MTVVANAQYDIVVAGGGMIGSTLALALAPLGLRVAVVEAVARRSAGQPSFDDRSTALSRSTQRTFEAMGLWPDIRAAATPVRHVHVSDRGRFGFSHIDADEQGVEALGYVVINRVLGAVLQTALDAAESVDLICPATVVGIERDGEAVAVSLDGVASVDRMSARLVVAADGAGSAVRDLLAIGCSRIDYGQHALIGNVLPAIAPVDRAFERFTEDGALAMLPVADRRAAFVWMQPPAEASRRLALAEDRFVAELQATFGMRLGRFSRIGKLAAYPLSLTRANALTVARGVVVGNAAHGLHPVAAQGFNLGVRDVAALCDCIADDLADGGTDPGGRRILDRYAAWRRADQAKLVRFTDGLVRLFEDGRPPVRAFRNVAMLAFDLVPGVRNLFARHTMGLAGKLPRLSRGVPIQ